MLNELKKYAEEQAKYHYQQFRRVDNRFDEEYLLGQRDAYLTIVSIIEQRLSQGNESMNGWQDRLVKEYKELKEKYNALHKAIVAHRPGVLPVAPLEGVEMWEEQANAMKKYLFVLEKRMTVHNIEVPKEG